ncbi:hypothetical protein GB928_023740 [Shinella curvata]|uniref:Uncharacterized protein n=1 Tax=Shinella curvata TaxID=1817964 RepID=A0ABT8XKF1_9HYPH|nr:hypothetical protein [Shinella curvata]MCJ8056878.1 hypothetical protein [Shinella curvata]MDO6124213.1 hypothetical protein [Shinella curvata]
MPSNDTLILELRRVAEAGTLADGKDARDLLDQAARAIRRLRKATGRGPTGNVADAVVLLDDVGRSIGAGLATDDTVRASLRDAAVMIRDLENCR